VENVLGVTLYWSQTKEALELNQHCSLQLLNIISHSFVGGDTLAQMGAIVLQHHSSACPKFAIYMYPDMDAFVIYIYLDSNNILVNHDLLRPNYIPGSTSNVRMHDINVWRIR
jgi:hypothetical protein